MRLDFQEHAVRRYRERYRRDLTLVECRNMLEAAAEGGAVPTGRQAYRGGKVYLLPAIGVEVVAVESASDRAVLAVVTTYPARTTRWEPGDWDDAELRRQSAEADERRAKAQLAALMLPQAIPADTPRHVAEKAIADARAIARIRLAEVQAIAVVARDELKTIRHDLEREERMERVRAALRVALRGLRDGLSLDVVLQAIHSIHPELAAPEFYTVVAADPPG
jgi:hypothetical protein